MKHFSFLQLSCFHPKALNPQSSIIILSIREQYEHTQLVSLSVRASLMIFYKGSKTYNNGWMEEWQRQKILGGREMGHSMEGKEGRKEEEKEGDKHITEDPYRNSSQSCSG